MEYSSEILDVTVVTSEDNNIQNDVPPIAWVMSTGEDKGIVEDITDDFAASTNMDNTLTWKNHCFLQGVSYIL